ncbi:MAG: TonB-dependent receptor [Candidatus Pseudobacter hemicellulosilyticus]|uniref:TonB-dependent receptor n=1 Tax=Candidatus Pseudobacter hemicellulosilyticus TaxID=3121375 RepID=A0AAJ6BFP9_9BACT|nr:MAG: TonB-dependent receptor [Pseudobacter sp.]
MKITFFLLLAALHVSAGGLGQEKLSLRFKQAEIASILQVIEKQSNFRFLYNDQLSGIRQKISLDVKEASIRQALDLIFANSPLTYQFMDNKLIVVKEEPVRERVPITGRITDENGDALSGVSINIKGSSRGTTSDDKGAYSISAEPTDVLIFTSVGFEPQETTVGARTAINITLISVAKNLENIVVIGYGQVRKRDLTGSVLSVKNEEIRKTPASNALESLQGKLAGADIVRNNGSAASGVSITIRGNRSLRADNGPLIIVDGVQYNSIQDISSNDIQSIEVLKDASSTAIYGSRGANGVVIVTTKRGATGKPKISAHSYYGISEVAGYPRFMNSTEYVDWRREANRRIPLAGINPNGNWIDAANDNLLFNSIEQTNINNGVNTDYPDLFLQQGNQQEHHVGVAAGNDQTKGYLSMGYYNEKGIFELDELKRYTARMGLDQQLGKIAKAGMQVQFTYYDVDTRTSPMDEASKISPFSLPRDSAGKVVLSPNNEAARWNPLIDEEPGIALNNTITQRTFAVAYVELNPFKGFSWRSNLGMVFTNLTNGAFYDRNSLLQRGTNALGSYLAGKGRNTNWENIISYNKQVNDHNFTLTGVTTFLQNNYEEAAAQGNKQVLPSQLYYGLANALDGIAIRSGYSKENLVSFAGRINYSMLGKYLASFSIRTDGSSKLGPGNKWSVFPAAALAWRISDEDFLRSSRAISDLKLRVSYGVTGSDAIPPYRTQSVLTRIPNAFGESPLPGFTFSDTIGNADLKWERTKAFNVGIDLGLFNNRVVAQIDVYRTQTTNLLIDRLLPPTSGVSRTFQNIGATRNTGIDIGINVAVIKKTDLSFNAGLNFYANKEEITDLLNGVDDVANKWFIGSPVRVSYDYRKIGIWQLADSTAAKAVKQLPGDIRVADLNGDKAITTEDREVVGQLVPKWNASLSLDFKYKQLDLNVFLFARYGQTIEYAYLNRVHLPGRENGAVVNYWTLENPSNDFPRPRTTSSFVSLPYSTTLQYVDGSFLKIRTITLGYTLPKTFTSRFGVNNLRVYATGRNLVTFSKVDDYDVERGGPLINPMTKLIVWGLSVDL